MTPRSLLALCLAAACLASGLVPVAVVAQDTAPRLARPDSVAHALMRATPEAYERLGLGGTIVLRVHVDTAGRADSLVVAASTGVWLLDNEAIHAVLTSRFTPGVRNGAAVAQWIELPLRFPDAVAGAGAPPRLAGPVSAPWPAQSRPRGLPAAPIEVPVSFILEIDASGRVVAESAADQPCFPAAVRAATEVVRTLRFDEAPTPGVRHTAVTVTLGDSVHVLARGDSLTPGPGDPLSRALRPGFQRPELSNHAVVRRALVRNYPAAYRDRGLGADVPVWFHIDESGRVARLRLGQSSGICEFDRAASNVGAVMQFRPGLDGGSPSAVWVRIPLVFTAR